MGNNITQKLDIWAHDIFLSFKQDGLVDPIMNNTNRYVKDIILPYSIIVTIRKLTERSETNSYDLQPEAMICSHEFNLKDCVTAITEKRTKKQKTIPNEINYIFKDNVYDESTKDQLLKLYSEQKIQDNMLLFKLYKDQIKDNQTVIITDKYSRGYFKSLQETSNDLFIMDINSIQAKDPDSVFTVLEELILIPTQEKRWTLCAVRLSWFDEFIGSIGIIFNKQPSHKSFQKIIDYLHAVKRNYSEEIMKSILEKASDNPEKANGNIDDFYYFVKNVIHQCIGSIRIILKKNNELLQTEWSCMNDIYDANKILFDNFISYFKFNVDNFNSEIALPVVTILEKKLLPILLKHGSDEYLIFLEAQEEYVNDYEKLREMAEQNIWKISWLWRNYNGKK